MKNVIEALYNGDVSPWSDKPHNIREMKKLSEMIDRHIESISENLSEDDREILKKIEDAHSELTHFEQKNAFKHGFSLGLRLTAEAFTNEIENDN